jgi:hypothetical protein
MPYPAPMKSSPGSAPIIKAGHTESDNFGTNSAMTGAWSPGVRDLEISTSGNKK